MRNPGKGSKCHAKSGQEVRKDRKSATGMSGSPKKGGHGGKFTWSGDGNSRTEIEFRNGAVDSKDPNFEDPEEIASVSDDGGGGGGDDAWHLILINKLFSFSVELPMCVSFNTMPPCDCLLEQGSKFTEKGARGETPTAKIWLAGDDAKWLTRDNCGVVNCDDLPVAVLLKSFRFFLNMLPKNRKHPVWSQGHRSSLTRDHISRCLASATSQNGAEEWCRKGCFSITFIFCPMPDPPAVSDNFEGILNVPIIFVKLELMG
ncbi:hypothetical protein CK203_071223 [Vitis vinifera]|uniref:Programmed cell death protein 4 n=1 Tax=Vitis vinifera TaxID=29760 RepID=A0A438DS61_VITVI|nr:hypothetical protein CK203_071223 [Vitis vinifera]